MKGRIGQGARFRALRFRADTTGAGTVFSLFLLFVSALFGGLAIDVGNAWRYNELLKTTADVAAHAGAVVLAQGGTVDDARTAALAALDYNMPEKHFGRILVQPALDVRAVHYDSGTDQLTDDGQANAIVVHVERSTATKNQVPTFLLRLGGRNGWNIGEESVAAVVPTRRCQGTNGIYASGVLIPGPGAHVRAGYCLHSQEKVVPAPGSHFDDGAGLSMPDIARCGTMCADGYSDGASAAAFEANLIREDLPGLIRNIATQFADPLIRGRAETAFFARRPLSEDLMPLDEVGVPIKGLTTGQIVDLTPLAFSRLRAMPEGLIYRVRCSAGQGEGTAGSNGTLTLTGNESGRIIRNLALITDCAVQIDATARLEGALIISTHAGLGFAVTAAAGAHIGDPAGQCGADRRSTILALGSVMLPAGVLGTNVGIVATDDIQITAPPIAGAVIFNLTGVGLHAGGAISLDVSHDFAACAVGDDPFTPALQVIRQVQISENPPAG